MKRFTLIAALLLLVGCTTATYGPVGDMIRDKQFDQYRSDLDQLESDYLKKKITYAEYLENKKMVDNKYQKKIDDRHKIILNQDDMKSSTGIAP